MRGERGRASQLQKNVCGGVFCLKEAEADEDQEGFSPGQGLRRQAGFRRHLCSPVPEPCLEGRGPCGIAGQGCYGITHSGREWVASPLSHLSLLGPEWPPPLRGLS